MAAILATVAVRLQHHRDGVPPNVGFDAALDRAIAGVFWLAARRDRIQIRGVRAVWQVRARATGEIDHLVEQEVGSFRTVLSQYRIDRFQPFTCLLRINVVEWIETRHRPSIGACRMAALYIA